MYLHGLCLPRLSFAAQLVSQHVSLPAVYAQLDGDRPSEICLLGFNVDVMDVCVLGGMFNKVDGYLSAPVQLGFRDVPEGLYLGCMEVTDTFCR